MKICQDHWHELKNAIRQRGMWKLVSTDGTGRTSEHAQDIARGSIRSTFDPLVMTNLMIADQALMALGDYLQTGNYCPLCEVEHNLGRGTSLEWIDVDADTVLRVCKEHRLIGGED